jgi:hypothetical protein
VNVHLDGGIGRPGDSQRVSARHRVCEIDFAAAGGRQVGKLDLNRQAKIRLDC